MLTQTQTTSFKVELMQAVHDFTSSTGDVFKLALYAGDATLNASTTVYTTAGEVTGTNYTAGGIALTNITPTSSGTTAFTSFDTATFTDVTLTARGALVYNSTKGNKSVCVLDFGSDITKTAADFIVTFPTASATDAVLRIS